MNSKYFISVAGLALVLAAGNVLAQDDDDLDGTMRPIGQADAELPAAVTEDITLPDAVGEDSEAVAASADGLATANEARTLRKEGGLAIADEASGGAAADARDRATDLAEAARDNADNRSRADDFRPETPDVPDRPEVPTPPTGG
ncbi:MAG: hypothetical protein WD078_04725 [Woeseia sp.]